MVLQRSNQSNPNAVDASSIYSAKDRLQKIRETKMGFYGSPTKHMGWLMIPDCGPTAFEATQVK